MRRDYAKFFMFVITYILTESLIENVIEDTVATVQVSRQ